MFVSIKFLFLVLFSFGSVAGESSCSSGSRTNGPRKFHLVRSCHKSTGEILSRRRAKTAEECDRFARDQQGFAFNYNPPEIAVEYHNCQVLTCPELANLTNLVNDTNFNYYSSFANLNALVNVTCIKFVGIFKLFDDKKNYTGAIWKCQESSGDLADVLSETRTNSLSDLIKNSLKLWYKAAYVGLDDRRIEGSFETPQGDNLGCFKFRAWAPGQPRSKRKDCVVLDDQRTWKAVNCKTKLPFLCELYPEGPQEVTTNNSRNQQEITEDIYGENWPNYDYVEDRCEL